MSSHSLEKGGGEWRRAPTELPPQGAPAPSLLGEGEGTVDSEQSYGRRRGGPNPTHPKTTPQGRRVRRARPPLGLFSLPNRVGRGLGPESYIRNKTAGCALLVPGRIMVWRLFTSCGSSVSCACGERLSCGSTQFDKTRQHSLKTHPTRVSHLALTS